MLVMDTYMAMVVEAGDRVGCVARDVFRGEQGDVDAATLEAGTVVRVERDGGLSVVAEAKTAAAELYGLVAEHRLSPDYPTPVMEETARCLKSPGLFEADLVDMTQLAFVTIDGPKTRDLDQALFVERVEDGYRALYAIADASYYVRPGSALFEDALSRGASYYLPGMSVPMLPRELSEGLISLNPNVERRASVFAMTVDADGLCTHCEVIRARIRSRGKLTFTQVEDFLNGDEAAVPAETHESLTAFAGVGEVRLADAQRRHVLRHRPEEVRIHLADDAADEDLGFVVVEEVRNRVEMYSEQLSLLCNIEGGRLLREGDVDDEGAQPIYRTHPAPSSERIEEFASLVRRVARLKGAPDSFEWDPERTPLSGYLRDLPSSGPFAGLSRAIARQAVMVNVRSTFSPEPGPHFGVGADVYARFSAPMREVVGVFVHKELWEILHGTARDEQAAARDSRLREQVSQRANAAKSLQRELTRAANLLVLERLFERALAHRDVPWFEATVMGMTRSKVHVRLEDPPVDVKVYVRHLDNMVVDDDGAALRDEAGELVAVLGDTVRVRPTGYDPRGRRFSLELTT